MRPLYSAAVVCVMLALANLHAGDPDYSFELSDAEGLVNETATTTVSVTINSDPISGWQLAVCHESAYVEIDQVSSLDFGNPDFESIIKEDNSWYVGALVDLGGETTISDSGDMYEASYHLLEIECSELVFCTEGLDADGLMVVSDDEVVSVTSFNSAELCAISNFTYQFPSVEAEYDSENLDLPAIEIPVAVCDAATLPLATTGFDMSLAYDPDVMTIVSAESGEILEALNDGAGADFFVTELDPGGDAGVTISVIYGLLDTVELVFSAECDEVAILGFERVDDPRVFDGDPVETAVDFEDGQGDPPVDNRVATEEEATPNWVGGTVTWVVIEELFSRGDADGNGLLFAIIDAIFLLEYGFVAGPTPPCLDAADVDDSGDVFPIIDALCLLGFGFGGECEIPAPTPPDCDVDPTDDRLDCESEPCI